jgi:hypothetical protein
MISRKYLKEVLKEYINEVFIEKYRSGNSIYTETASLLPL